MENTSTRLFNIVHDKATKEYRNILVHGFPHFTFFLQQELMAPPPLDVHERNHIVDQWLTNLNIIRHALLNFPKLTTKSGTLSTSHSPSLHGSPSIHGSLSLRGSPSQDFTPLNTTGEQQTPLTSTVGLLPPSDNTAPLGPAGNIPVSPAHSLPTPTSIARPINITPTSTTKDKPTKRSHSATESCLKRDGFQCCLTGRPSIEGFAIEGAHIMPFALANEASCRNLDFWQMLDIFYGKEATDMLFAGFAGKGINSLANLISLDNSIHSMFDNRTLRLAPLTPQYEPIPVFNNHIGSYLLRVDYKQTLSTPELIQSTRIHRTDGVTVGPLYGGSMIPITYKANVEEYIRTIPFPGFFALRLLICELQDHCPPSVLTK